MSTFYLDYELGNDSTTATPLGWWSVVLSSPSGTQPAADETMTGATSGATAKLTIAPSAWTGTPTIYFYGKSGTFQSETVNFSGGGSGTISADLTYCAWKTITSGATAARIAPGDIIRIAKSPTPTSIGNATWTSTTETGGGFPATKNIGSSTNASPIVVTLNSHGYSNGDVIQIVGHTTNTDANGAWIIANVSANTFELVGSVGNGTGGASGTAQKINSKAVVLATAQNVNIDRCDKSDWTPVNATSSARILYTTDAKEGGSCIKIVEDGTPAADEVQAYFATGDLTLSSYQKISFWIKNEVAILANQLELNLCSNADGTGDVDVFPIPAIPSTGQWVPLTIARNGGGNLGSSTIKSINISNGSSATTYTASKYVYIDNIIACTSSGLNLQSLISKNTLEQSTTSGTGYGNEGWYGIQSINEKVVLLDNDVQTKSNAGRGYYSSTSSDTVTTYIRETFKQIMTSSSTYFNSIQDSGTLAGGDIQFQGGYSNSTNLQSGETFYNGLSGTGVGIYSNSKNYITVNHLSFTRFSAGISTGTGSRNITFTTISDCNNCSSTAIQIAGTQSYNSYFDNIINCNNNSNNNSSNIGFSPGSTGGNSIINNIINCNNSGSSTTSDGIIFSGDGNNKINSIINCCNNSRYGISFISPNNIIYNVNNCSSNVYAISGASHYNKINSITTEDNSSGCITSALGQLFIRNATIGESIKVEEASATSGQFSNRTVYLSKYGGDINDNRIYKDYGNIISQSTTRHTESGIAWQLNPTNTLRDSNYPIYLSVAKIACVANKQVTVTAWMKISNTTDILGALVCRVGQIAWSDGTADIQTNCSTADTDWHQVQIQFTPTEAGVVEIEALAWWVANTADESVYIDDITITQAA